MKISKKLVQLCNIVCAVLMIALLLMQLLPFWTFPACTCTGKCEKLNTDTSCAMCKVYYKACVNIPAEELSAGTNRLDYSKEWDLSIQEYTWMPTFDSSAGATDYFADIFDTDDYEYMVKDIVIMPILVLFGTVFGAYICFTKSSKSLSSVFCLVVGLAGTIGYLTMPIFQMGALWQIHLALSAVILLVSLVPTAEYVNRAIQWFLPKKAQ